MTARFVTEDGVLVPPVTAERMREIDRIATVTSALELATAEQSRFDAIAQQRQAIELAEDALQRVLFENSEWVRPVK